MTSHNKSIFFTPTKEHFSEEQVNGIDKFMNKPIVKGLVQIVGGHYDGLTYEYESDIVFNPTWFDLLSIAKQQSHYLQDTHHVFLESFEIVNAFRYIKASELGLSNDETSERKQKITLVSLFLGS
tara:strand:+ start:182 stop:556 length:375 start_codon:yes stop_codon:yes gene_type:complete